MSEWDGWLETKAKVPPAPWLVYDGWKPDDRTWFVADVGMPKGLGPETVVEVLIPKEAIARKWESQPRKAKDWSWNTNADRLLIVAWRPVAEDEDA